MNCLSERELTAVALGDAPDAAHEHVARCAACAERARRVARELARLRTVLGEPPPRAQPARAFEIRWTAVAAAAVLVLAVALAHHTSTPSPAPDDRSALALLDEVADTMLDATSLETAAPATTASTCTWGDPLLGVGCGESAATQIAWR